MRSPQHPCRCEGRVSNFSHSPFSSLRGELRPGVVYEAAPLPSSPPALRCLPAAGGSSSSSRRRRRPGARPRTCRSPCDPHTPIRAAEQGAGQKAEREGDGGGGRSPQPPAAPRSPLQRPAQRIFPPPRLPLLALVVAADRGAPRSPSLSSRCLFTPTSRCRRCRRQLLLNSRRSGGMKSSSPPPPRAAALRSRRGRGGGVEAAPLHPPHPPSRLPVPQRPAPRHRTRAGQGPAALRGRSRGGSLPPGVCVCLFFKENPL